MGSAVELSDKFRRLQRLSKRGNKSLSFNNLSAYIIPSVDKGTHGFAPQICDSAALLSLSVRPVRFVPVPCRITNLRRKTPSDPKYRLLVAGKATE